MNINLFDKLRSRTIITSIGCWEWQGAKNSFGYANTWLDGKYINAHRAMYLAIYDEIPENTCICHSCDNPACINPEHLFLGTQKENVSDMHSKNRHSHGETHSQSMRNAWTPEKRILAAERTKQRMQEIHRLQAINAGVPDNWKYCPRCLQWLPRTEFGKNSARYDGLNSYCRPCRSKH